MKRKLAMLLTVLIVLFSMPLSAFSADFDAELDSLNKQYEELEKQQKAIQNEINKASSNKAKQLALKKQLDSQIYAVRQQIDVLTSKMKIMEQTIAQREDELLATEQDLFLKEDTLKQRMNAMYKTGNSTVLGLVLGADSFFDFLTRAKVASQIAISDRELIKETEQELAVLEEIRADIQKQQADLEAAKNQMSDKKTQLDGQVSAAKDMIQDIEQQEKEYKANKSVIDKQMKAVEAEVDAIYAQINSVGDYDGGKMLWPVSGYPNISSQYGWRFGGTDFHTGLDIYGRNYKQEGIFGKPILAADDGVVAFVQPTFVQGRGYGIYAIVDHGGGVTTRYAHQSGLKVKKGDQVSRGDVIGYVGSTGWSTGPHLHFEVRVNGKHLNPWSYLK